MASQGGAAAVAGQRVAVTKRLKGRWEEVAAWGGEDRHPRRVSARGSSMPNAPAVDWATGISVRKRWGISGEVPWKWKVISAGPRAMSAVTEDTQPILPTDGARCVRVLPPQCPCPGCGPAACRGCGWYNTACVVGAQRPLYSVSCSHQTQRKEDAPPPPPPIGGRLQCDRGSGGAAMQE